jgi:folylpolyglutamate synthase/dihydropteroate synthase
MLPMVTEWYIGELPGNSRAAKASNIRNILHSLGVENVIESQDVAAAWNKAKQNQTNDQLLLGFGSFYTVAEILKAEQITEVIL